MAGLIGGGHVGLQQQRGSLVYGLEVSFSGLDDFSSQTSYRLQTPARDDAKFSQLFSVVGKLGYAWSPDLLSYVKAGYVSTKMETRFRNAATGEFEITSAGREDGWTIGLGIDRRLHANFHPNIVIGVDYNYHKFTVRNRSNEFVTPASPNETITKTNIESDEHTITARISLLFGPQQPAYKPLK